MNRCLLVATDGSPAARAALLYALDFASALDAEEIACLSVHEASGYGELASAAVPTAGDMALATGTPGPILFELAHRPAQPANQPDRVLEACRDQVLTAGYRFTPILESNSASRVISRTAPMTELIFLGRNSSAAIRATHLGSTVAAVLRSVPRTVVVCPLTYVPLDRIVLLMAGDWSDAELVATGTTWADALDLPALLAVADSGRPYSRNALDAARRVVTHTGVRATGTMYTCPPEEFVQKLNATDLVLVARRRRSDLVQLWFGNAPDRIVEHSAGPVAVMATP